MYFEDILFIILFSAFFSLVIAFPIIKLLYKFKILRQLDVDFSAIVEARKAKLGVPIMGGLVIVIPVLILNLVFSPTKSTLLAMSVFAVSSFLGAVDDIANIYGRHRKIKSIKLIVKLIKVHKSILKRVIYLVTLPWHIYKRAFYVLGSNPGKGLFAHEKILVQIFAGGAIAVWSLYYTDWVNPTELWIPFINTFDISWLMFPFIIFVVVAMTNAVNIADGMDGLAAGLLLPPFAAFMFIAMYIELPNATRYIDFPNTILCATVIGALLAYLYFNIPPARFQMGDVGSLALGSLLAVVAFNLRVPLLLPIIAFPFVVEISSVLIQAFARRLFGRRVFQMAPLHHHFEIQGWSEEKTVMRFWIFGFVSSVIGLWVFFADGFPFI